MELNVDGTLSLPALTLTAQQLDDLLKELALARAQMRPAVANVLDIESVSTLVAETSPACLVHRSDSGRVVLGIRHSGYGWLVFRLQRAAAMDIARSLGGDLGAVD